MVVWTSKMFKIGLNQLRRNKL